MTPSRSSAVNSPVIVASAACAARKLLGEELERRLRRGEVRCGRGQMLAAARAAPRDAARARGTSPPCPRARRRCPESPAAAARCPRRSSPTGRRGVRPAPRPCRLQARCASRPAGPRRRDRSCCERRAAGASPAARPGWPHPRRRCRRRRRRRPARARDRPARSPPTCARCPSVSTGSSVGRRPAVSTMVSGMPWISTWERTASRVVPAIGVTIATSSPASWFSRLDLPTLGRPTSTTVRPSRRSAPCVARARTPRHPRLDRRRASRARRRRAGNRGPRRESRASLR